MHAMWQGVWVGIVAKGRHKRRTWKKETAKVGISLVYWRCTGVGEAKDMMSGFSRIPGQSKQSRYINDAFSDALGQTYTNFCHLFPRDVKWFSEFRVQCILTPSRFNG